MTANERQALMLCNEAIHLAARHIGMGTATKDEAMDALFAARQALNVAGYRVADEGAFTAPASAPGPNPYTEAELRALVLRWPTNYKVITQRFGMRPEYYEQFGLPGHEGLDIRALAGTPIYACADGVVKLVAAQWRAGAGGRKADHPYGYQIRLRHKCIDGEYETVYAHCADKSAKVKEGDAVIAGQVIALADATGNVQPRGVKGSHLHLMLKKIGTRNGGYGEIIDPTPYFESLP